MNDLDELLPAIASGDATAFGSWLAHAERPLRESLRSFAASVDTEAVVQETMLRMWQVAPRFVPDGRPNALLRLAVRTSRNLAISEVRKHRTRAVEPEDIEIALSRLAETDRVQSPDPKLQLHIANCREKLPDKPAQALHERLQCAGAEPDETLAARLGMKLNTFLQNFTRARKLLEECLRACGVDVHMEIA